MKCIFCVCFFLPAIFAAATVLLWHCAVFKSKCRVSTRFIQCGSRCNSSGGARSHDTDRTAWFPGCISLVAVFISKTHNRHRPNTDNKTNKLLIHVVSIFKIVWRSLRVWLIWMNSCMNDLWMNFETAALGVCLSLIAVGRVAVDLVDLSY